MSDAPLKIRVAGLPFRVCPICGDAQCAADEHEDAVWIPAEMVAWRGHDGSTGVKRRGGFWAVIPQ